MILILRTFYIILIGFMAYRMFKNGGCCGGHSHSRENSCHEKVNENKTLKQIITEEEKRNAIDIK